MFVRKFKAYNKLNNTFSPECTLNELFANEFGSLDDRRKAVPDLVWLECTHLADESGRVLWEGDILEQEIRNEWGSIQIFVGVMEWNPETGGFMGRYNAPHCRPYGPQKPPRYLGNIFQNKDLLKVDESKQTVKS